MSQSESKIVGIQHVVLYRNDGSRYEIKQVLDLPIEFELSYPDTYGPDGPVRKWIHNKGTLENTIGIFDQRVRHMKNFGYKTVEEATGRLE